MDCKVSEAFGAVEVVLSRRNLEALLLKLDEPGSARTLTRMVDGWCLIVHSEDNDQHYADRAAGRMHPREESRISQPTSGVL